MGSKPMEEIQHRAVKTTIVGGQPSNNQRPLQVTPVGVEQLLAMAAVDEKFAEWVLKDREQALAASGISLNATEQAIFQAISRETLEQMILSVQSRIPLQKRREFLKKSAAAFFGLASIGLLTTGSPCSRPATGSVPDFPAPTGSAPDFPAPTGSAPDFPSERGSRPDYPNDSGFSQEPVPAHEGDVNQCLERDKTKENSLNTDDASK